MKRIRNLSIFNAVSLLIHISIAYLTQTRIFDNSTIGEISNKYPSLFIPANITFLIWSAIYAGLIAFCIYHLRMAHKAVADHPANADAGKIGWLFIINNLATAAWLIAWVKEQLLLSVLLIAVQMITLIIIHIRLKIHDAHASLASKTFTQFPLSIYLGWISIATIANLSSYLSAIHWSGWGVSDINWTITMVLVTVLVTVGIINRRRNVFFGLTVIWGLYGILLKRSAIDAEAYQPIIMVIWGSMAIISVSCLFGLARNLRKTIRKRRSDRNLQNSSRKMAE